ncbi:type II toxin-antitoxin system HipA family toxin [Salinibacterium sp. SWN248]|uniref:type II toxin-antitoxin system HipA family toxin n=1 Tax=Salinibacterium sp. SWN248 TaxID=2792056 RepID=UPI0018CC9867|nr:type II toxin-antitoxin system HipA family toxin [Salinibacterium sp. SWN248]MBH0022700.1 type II toxin-antitoxin system HipA family toxin [Salinibacterium sp. SWN248]
MREPLASADVSVVLPDGAEVQAGTVASEGASSSAATSLVFRYTDSYVTDPRGYDLSPDMPRTSGPIRTWSGRETLGALGDSMPDAWGKRIIRAGTPARTTLDFLTHVNDATRQGALRLRDAQGTYLGAHNHPVAEVHDLTRIVAAARAFEAGEETDAELQILADAGTSAGGARPKATVTKGGELWMAKFARETEFYDPMAWEATALALAKAAGIHTPEFDLVRLSESQSILLSRRFDRDSDRRIGYISAHSLTTKSDNHTLSYSDLADTLAQYSPAPSDDQAELFRRIALNLIISNVDDHFRNHGFLRDHNGWSLSPVFDLEPNRRPDHVEATPIVEGGERYGRDIRQLRDAHDAFRLSRDDASAIVRDVAARTTDWTQVAVSYGISPEAAESSRRAIDGPNRERALAMTAGYAPPSGASNPRSAAQKRRGQLGVPGNSGQWARTPEAGTGHDDGHGHGDGLGRDAGA